MTKPTSSRRMAKSLANAAPTTGRSQAQLVRTSNRWRDSYNPLRSLIISRLVTYLEAGERGEYAELQWLYRMIEKRYPVLRALKARRLAAIAKLDWDIKVVARIPSGLERMAEEQQAMLRERYDAIKNLRAATRFLALAEFRGFSHIVKHRDDTGTVNELHWLPQWNFVRDGSMGDWYWNSEAKYTNARALGEENRIGGGLDRSDFVIRECDSGINEIGAIAFVNAAMAKKDWAAFVEIFGLPNVVIELPPNIPSGKESEYETAAASVAEGGNGCVPNGAKPYFPGAAVRTQTPFKEFLEWEEKDVVLAGTGGKLTMLNEATGIGGSQGKVHQDAFDELAQAEALEISEVFQADFDAVELKREFPGRRVLAYFELAAQQKEDVQAFVQNVATLKGAGYRIDSEQIAEKTCYELEEIELAGGMDARPGTPAEDQVFEDDDEPAATALANTAPSPKLLAAGRAAIAQAEADALAPLRAQMLAVIEAGSDAEFQARFAELQRTLSTQPKELFKDLPTDAILATLGAAAASGITTKP